MKENHQYNTLVVGKYCEKRDPYLTYIAYENGQNRDRITLQLTTHCTIHGEEEYKSLRDSVDSFDRYDSLDLVERLEKHDLIFSRQIADHLYKKNKKWGKSIAVSKESKCWKEAIDTALASSKTEVVEELLQYLVNIGSKECYVATLYTCYNFIRQDIVRELSWVHGLEDYSMPYSMNIQREAIDAIVQLERDNDELKVIYQETKKKEQERPIFGVNLRLLLMQERLMGFKGGF